MQSDAERLAVTLHALAMTNFAPDRLECHLICRTSSLLLPLKEQFRVGCGDVIAALDLEKFRGSTKPPRRALDLAEVPDRRFVHNYASLAVTPLSAELFVPKGR